MSPRYALDLDHEGVALLRAEDGDWTTLGRADLQDPNFQERLDYLRRQLQADPLAGQDSQVILLLPESQILFTKVPASGLDQVADDGRVRRALDGSTPYALDDLVYDWTESGGTLYVAVVAKDTLSEASGFASGHGFHPSGFGARPDPVRYPGVPSFDPARQAPQRPMDDAQAPASIATGTETATDTNAEPPAPKQQAPKAPVKDVDGPPDEVDAPVQKPASAETAAPNRAKGNRGNNKNKGPGRGGRRRIKGTDQAGQASAAAPEESAAAEAANDPSVPANTDSEIPTPAEPETEQSTQARPIADPAKPVTDASSQDTSALPAEEKPVVSKEEDQPQAPPSFSSRRRRTPTAKAEPTPKAAQDAPVQGAPVASKKKPDAPNQQNTQTDPSEGRSAGALIQAFRSRQKKAATKPTAERKAPQIASKSKRAGPTSTGSEAPQPKAAAAKAGAPKLGAAAAAGTGAPKIAAISTAPRTSTPVKAPPKPSATKATRSESVAKLDRKAKVPKAKDKPAAAPVVEQPRTPTDATVIPLNAPTGIAPTQSEPMSEAESLTVFGARRTAKKPVQRKAPRFFGLVLTLGLLALMGLVAAWSLYFGNQNDLLSEGTPTPDTPPVVASQAPDAGTDTGIAQDDPPEPSTAQTTTDPAPEPEVPAASETADVPLDDPSVVSTAPPRRADPDLTLEGEAPVTSETLGLRPEPSAPEVALTTTAPPIALQDPGQAELPEIAGTDAPVQEKPEPLPAETTAEIIPEPTDEERAAAALAALRAAPPEPVPLDIESARAAYAATGLWLRAPDPANLAPQDALEDLYVASIDPNVTNVDALALPEPTPEAARDLPLEPPALPLPYGVVLGPDGMVVPTPEGALNPGGILVFSGPPDIIPPRRPEDAAVPGAASPEGTEAANPFARFRPRPRPDDLTELNERAIFGGRTVIELATLRPRTRPASVQQQAEAAAQEIARAAEEAEARAAAEAAEAAAQQRTPEQVAADEQARLRAAFAANPRALRTSPPPRAKPSNIAQIAARTTARAERAAQREARRAANAAEREGTSAEEATSGSSRTQSAAASTAAPSTRSNPGPAVSRSQRVRPTVPSSATVAKQATIKNALALNRVGLIGVYGAPNQRRALVRLPSGRYVKVQVGDRLDGGRVKRIGEGEVRYTKGGREVVLKMPKT